MMKNCWQQSSRPLLLGMLFSLALTGAALACQVPVFRYALERWNPDQYQVVVLAAGELDRAAQQSLSPLTGPSTTPAPAKLKVIDVSQTEDAVAKALWTKHSTDHQPVIVTLYPDSYDVPADQVAHACTVSATNVQRIMRSPARDEVAKRLTEGQSAVWVLLECGDAAKDQAALQVLQQQIEKDADWLALPSAEELEIKPEVLAKAKIKLQIAFSVISVGRDEPQEKFLVDCLLNSEPDLQNFDEPIAFPVFGRGRVLYALVGQGIAADTIRSASSFIVGPCSCQVKEQNPGFDLLLSCDWDGAVGGTFISSPLPGAATEPRLLTIPPGRAPRQE